MPERIRLLELVVLMIKTMKAQIEFSRLPVESLLVFLNENRELAVLSFIKDTLTELKNGADFNSAWKNAVTDFAKTTPLKADDINLITAFSNGFGNSDVSGQLSNCDTYINLIELKISSMKGKAENSVKICNTLGVLAAAMTLIVFY